MGRRHRGAGDEVSESAVGGDCPSPALHAFYAGSSLFAESLAFWAAVMCDVT